MPCSIYYMVQKPYSVNYERAILHHHIPDEPYHVSSAAYDAAYLLKMYPMKIEHRTAPSNSPIYHLQDQGPRTKDQGPTSLPTAPQSPCRQFGSRQGRIVQSESREVPYRKRRGFYKPILDRLTSKLRRCLGCIRAYRGWSLLALTRYSTKRSYIEAFLVLINLITRVRGFNRAAFNSVYLDQLPR
jgi:hypothetical protein